MFRRVLMAALVVLGVAVGVSTPATASEPLNGFYVYNQPGEPVWIWQVYPLCVQAGCVMHVSITAGPEYGTLSDRNGYGGDARLTNGLWTFGTNRGEGIQCPDGTIGPTSEMYVFDDVSMTGTVTKMNKAQCGLKPGVSKSPFTLTYAGPLQVPVTLDPLNQIPDKW